MKVIGITGGVGSGKTQLLSYIEGRSRCRVIYADELAHTLEEPGEPCYEALIRLLGREILSEDGRIDRKEMAARIFADRTLLQKVNAILHPAVKERILAEMEKEKVKQRLDFLFIEAALLVEEGYGQIVDELWYIYAKEAVRRERLRDKRGYTEEKTDRILKEQLSEEEYRRACGTVIDNSGPLQDTYRQMDKKLEEYL